MADGYEVIVKINLPPAVQYHSGHSVIVQGHTGEEVAKSLDSLTGHEGNGALILAAFTEYGLKTAVEQALAAGTPPKAAGALKREGTPAAAKKESTADKVARLKAEKAAKAEPARDAKAENEGRAVSTPDEAPAAEAAAPAEDDELAKPTLIKGVAKATGKSVEELDGITKSEALRLMKEAKGGNK